MYRELTARNTPTPKPERFRFQQLPDDKAVKAKNTNAALFLNGWLRHTTLLMSVMFVGTPFLFGLGLISYDAQVQANQLGQLEDKFSTLSKLLDDYQLRSEKGEPEGYAPLGSDGIIPAANLPSATEFLLSFLGCWNAMTNVPMLVSSMGEEGAEYSVCTAGMTLLNGVSNWNPYDLVLFVHDLFEWVLFEGTTNTIEDVTPLAPGEVSVVADSTGPFFTMNKWDGEGNVSVDMVGDTLVVDGDAPLPPTVTLSSSGTENPVTDGVGPDLSVKTIEGLNDVNVTSTNDSVTVSLEQSQVDVDFGFSDITIVSFPGIVALTNPISLTYTRVGETWRIQLRGQPQITWGGPLVQSASITLRLSTATDSTLSAARHNGPGETGGVIAGKTTTSAFVDLPMAGYCVGAAVSTDIDCFFNRWRSDEAQAYFYNLDFLFREFQP